MKKAIKLLALLLTFILTLNVAACSSYNAVKTALEGAGYTIVENGKNDFAQEAEEDERVANIYVFTNGESLSALELYKLTTVAVIEFKATEDLVEYFKESNTIQGIVADVKEDGTADEIYAQLKELGVARNNCIILPIGLDSENVFNAIKAI